MGYDVKRFADLGILDWDAICPICIGVFRDPVTTKCRHTYCRECITEWLTRQKICPLDQRPVESLIRPPLFVINILSRLVICCDYEEKGCQTTVKLEDLAHHVAICPIRLKSVDRQVLTNFKTLINRSFKIFAPSLNKSNQRYHENSRHQNIQRPRQAEISSKRSSVEIPQSEMGYDVKRFADLGVLAEDITCPICMNVFRDPITTKCRHTYCRECITEWLQRHQTCPLDQMPVENLSTLTRPPIFVINILGRLVICCDFKDKGCQTTVKLEDLAHHVATCPFRPKSAVSQVLINLTKLSNRMSFPSFTAWLNRANQRYHGEHPPTPPARYRIRSRPRHTELARQRERRDENDREEDLITFLFVFLIFLAGALYSAIIFRFAIEFILVFFFKHISIMFFAFFVALVDFNPRPYTGPLEDLLP